MKRFFHAWAIAVVALGFLLPFSQARADEDASTGGLIYAATEEDDLSLAAPYDEEFPLPPEGELALGEGIPLPRIGPMGRGRAVGPGLAAGALRFMERELNLSQEQIGKLDETDRAFRKDMLNHRIKLEPKELELQALLLEKEPNMAAVRNKLQEIAPLRAEAEFMRIKHSLDMENVLTPEQKAKLGQLRRVGRNVRERIIDRIQVPRFFRFERETD